MANFFTAKKAGRLFLRIFLRSLLVIFTLILLVVIGLCMTCNLIFNGPSKTARDVLTMSMLESSALKWVPAVFLGEETVSQIKTRVPASVIDDVSDVSQVIIDINSSESIDAWANYPDGIRIETVYGDTYTAHIMLIRDPSTVYLATSTETFSLDIPGTRITSQIKKEGALAAINAGAFNDDGTASSYVGSLPIGMVVSEGKIAWDDGKHYKGFVGFNQDNVLIVANSMDAAMVEEMNIRDGCCFGPVLIMNGHWPALRRHRNLCVH